MQGTALRAIASPWLLAGVIAYSTGLVVRVGYSLVDRLAQPVWQVIWQHRQK